MVDQVDEELAMREVDDALRRKELEELWKKFRKVIIGGIAAIILFVAGHSTYTYLKKSSEEKSSIEFTRALTEASKEGADAAAVWEKAIKDMNPTYAMMGKMQMAASFVKADKIDEALKAYSEISASASDERLKDLATYYSAMLQMDKKKDYAAARSLYMTLSTNDNSAFRLAAAEQLAVLSIHEGELEKAKLDLNLLSKDEALSSEMKERVRKLISIVEGKLALNAASKSSEKTDQ